MNPIKYAKLKNPINGKKYMCTETFRYFSPKYQKTVTVDKGYMSDGATWAPDIKSNCWWIHDVLCDYCKFDDGTPCTNWQASNVLFEVMRREGRSWLRANRWRWATFLMGGQKIKAKNGWW